MITVITDFYDFFCIFWQIASTVLGYMFPEATVTAVRIGVRKNRDRLSISYSSEEDHDGNSKKIRKIEKQIKSNLGSDYERVEVKLFPTRSSSIFESESEFPEVDEKNDKALEDLIKMAEGKFELEV